MDSAEGYRNGYGKPRRLAMSSGTITLRRPRVRGVEERFESRVLPLFARRTKELGALLPELYLHGLAEGDFELAMRGLLGEGAPLSKSSIRRLRAGWTAEFEEWSQRRLEGREVVYVWADGIYVKAGLERDKAALLVVLGAMRDGTKEVLALRSGYRESVESCSEVLRDLKARGIEAPRLLMADGNAAIWGAVRQVWPEAGEQRCWNHKMRNVLDRLPQREQSEAKDLLRAVVYAPSRAEAVKAREAFARRYKPWYPKAADVLEDDWERMVAFYDFPEDHWKHLRTTNVVESPFAAVRLRTTAAKRFKRVESATALIWKLLWWRRSDSEGSTLLTSSRTYLKEESSKTESPSHSTSGRTPPETFTHLLTQPRTCPEFRSGRSPPLRPLRPLPPPQRKTSPVSALR